MNEDVMLEKIKEHLRITWNYEDEQLLEMIEEGKEDIRFWCGQDVVFKGRAFALLKEWCRYYRSGAIATFEENYRSRIISLQLENGVL